ncbi:MAG TPA: tRNA dihydrouridine synthase DusB [Candidatus Competibacteraceae bacterium]|nr:tRNA dihydrouridine synthase DusB [Candidatus Competibacteraceae bacterium]
MHIGPYTINPPVVLAPMAGVTDRPFRQLCKQLGAGMAVSEMVTSDPRLWHSAKTRRRLDHAGEVEPISVQIAGYDPAMMAEAARFNVEHGAQIIDINMGCPAKKVCNVMAGSALLRDEPLVGRILEAVVKAVEVPVTLKIRTGWDRAHRNGVSIARIAQESGICALTVHGRTRADLYQGQAEYDTIRAIAQAVSIPVIANGDIDTPEKARAVLEHTGVGTVMIGRAAQGRPWIFREIAHYLRHGQRLPEPPLAEVATILLEHLENLYAFYGEYLGVRVARKHLSWYSQGRLDATAFRAAVNRAERAAEQLALTRAFFERLAAEERLAA